MEKPAATATPVVAPTQAAPAPTFESIIAAVVTPSEKTAKPDSAWPAEIVEVDDETGEVDGDALPVEETADDAEADAPEEVETENEAEPPTYLKTFRKDDGKLDEERIERTITEGGQNTQIVANINALLNENPALRKEWARALKAKGVPLTIEQETLIAEKEKPATPAVPAYTQADVDRQVNKIMATGDIAAALRYRDKWDLDRVAERNALAEERKRIADESAARQAQEAQRAAATQFQTQVHETVKSFPTLFKKDNSQVGYAFADKAVADKFAEIQKDCAATMPFARVLKLTLAELNRLGSKPPAPPARNIAKPSYPAKVRPRVASSMHVPQIEILARK